MKKLFLLAAAAFTGVFAMTLHSCDNKPVDEPDDPKTLVVSPLTLTLAAEGETKTVSVTGEGWSAEPSAEWIVVEDSADGSGFTVTAGATTEEREGSITVSNEDDSHTVTVTQSAPEIDLSITVNPTELSFTFEAGEQNVAVTSELEWTATTTDAWITVTKTNETEFKVEVAANSEINAPARNGSITVSNSENTETVTVTQAAPPATDTSITLNPEDLSFTFEAGEQNVAVTSELAWTVTSNDSWITATKTNDTQLKVVVTANSGEAKRTGSVTVANGTETTDLTVEQGADMGVQMIRAKGMHMTETRAGVTREFFDLDFTTYEGSNLTFDPNDPSDNGYHLFLRIYSAAPAAGTQWHIPEGEYTYDATRNPFTIFNNGYDDACYLQLIENGAWKSDIGVFSGSTMTVSGNGTDGYTITFNIVGNGTTLKAYYEGLINMPR